MPKAKKVVPAEPIVLDPAPLPEPIKQTKPRPSKSPKAAKRAAAQPKVEEAVLGKKPKKANPAKVSAAKAPSPEVAPAKKSVKAKSPAEAESEVLEAATEPKPSKAAKATKAKAAPATKKAIAKGSAAQKSTVRKSTAQKSAAQPLTEGPVELPAEVSPPSPQDTPKPKKGRKVEAPALPAEAEPVLLKVPKQRKKRGERQPEPSEPTLTEVLSGVEEVVLSEPEPLPGLQDEPSLKNLSAEQQLVVEQLRKLGRPVHVRDLEKTFTRQALDRLGGWRKLGDLLEELTEQGQVVRTRRRTYGLPEAMSLVRGRFQASSSGFGFVIPDSGHEDYYVPPERTLEAWNGDIVLVRMEGRGDSPRGGGPRRGQKGDGSPRATVVRIVQRAYQQLVGTLEFHHGHPILRPDDHRARHRILLLPDGLEDLEAGARVVTELYWPEHTGEDEVFGQVVRLLGEQDDPATETEAVIVKYGLRGEFPEEVLAQAEAIPAQIPAEALQDRLDLREYNIFTVDGRDAKDFDDAIHIQPTPEGTFVVGVHIADVSHYVPAGSALDREAYARATSVYLPGRVLPMLPEHLSNGVCSLVPYQDRLTMTALVELSAEADILDVKITPSVINSKARLTYDEVQAYSEATATLPEHARHLEGDLHLLLKIAAKLRQRRLRQGSLDFKLREVKVEVDADGHLELIPIREETARGMIEDLMLLANKVVAHFLLERDIPTLFRVHEEPTLQRFQEVTGAIGRMGLGFPGGQPTPQAYQAVLKQVRGTGRESVVNTLLLRSMQQAKYAGENLGHFGLAFDEYLHFTSPIRRYPDLVVHRTIKAVQAGEYRAGSRAVAEFQARLPGMGEHTSERERGATEAERDLTKYYQAKWAQEHLEQSFSGNVSGVVASGLYIALENGVEGKLHISHLADDYYLYLEDAQMLKGRSRQKTFRLGDEVKVTISSVNPLARQIDFVLIEAEDAGTRTPQANRASSRGSGPHQRPPSSQEQPVMDANVKVRARRREEREQERQEKLKNLPITTPKFTLEDPQPAVVSPRSSVRPRQGQPSTRAQPRSIGQVGRSAQPQTPRSAPTRSPAPGRGPKRVITLERPRNEHLRPVNITVQRLYFGDWTVDQLPPDDGFSGPRAGRERGYSRSERSSGGRGWTRGGSDRGAVRQLNGQPRSPERQDQRGRPNEARGNGRPAPVQAQAVNAQPTGEEGQGTRRRRRRRR